MRLGLFGARADSRGLCYQTQAYAKHLPFDRILGIDMTADDLSPYPCDWDQYEGNKLTVLRYSQLSDDQMRMWLGGLDVVLGAETFYRDEFVTIAREMGVPTVLACNPEFVPWYNEKVPSPKPDVLINPTIWRMDFLPDAIHLPFPVDRELFPFRLRTSADHFVHVAGHKAAADRAGTRIVLGELARMKARGINVTIRTQSDFGWTTPAMSRATIEKNIANPADLYADTDILLQPRRYGGNSLVHNEALSCGIPIISIDRVPENTWGGVITTPARTRGHLRTKAGQLQILDSRPGHLGKLMVDLRDDPSMVERLSRAADEYAESISWPVMRPMYLQLLEKVADA